MEQEDSKSALINSNGEEEAKFSDAFEEFHFVDASNSLESDHSISVPKYSSASELDNADVAVSTKSINSPESPSSAGLRRRRLASQQSWKGFSRSNSLKNNYDSLGDCGAHGSTISSGKKYKLSWSLKDNEKLREKLNSSTVRASSGSVVKLLNEETNGNSTVTSAITDGNDDERMNDASTLDSPSADPNFLFILAGLVIKAIGFQIKFVVKFVTFPVWLMYSSYMFVIDPFGVMRRGRNYVLRKISRIWRICFGSIKWMVYMWIKKNESTWKFFLRMGWGFLWSAYVGFILVSLLVSAFIVSGIMMKYVLEEPIELTEQLNFDYTSNSPVAFVPIMSCPESACLDCSENIRLGSTTESRFIPPGHKLKTTVSLTLPESDYNRNLGIFQVRVDFLSDNGKPLGSTRQPSMLHFRSQPIRLLLTFFKLGLLVTGYSSESQILDIKFRGYTERDVPTSCLRVVMEQRAQFAKGGGVPEIYAASLKLESELPLLKRILWSWKGTIYVWTSLMMLALEFLFALLCCTPIIVPWLNRRDGSLNRNTSRNTRPSPS